MKATTVALITLAIVSLSLHAEPEKPSTPYYKTIPGWKRLWLPVVPWRKCPVTPDKQRENYFMGYGDLIRRMDASNNTGRY